MTAPIGPGDWVEVINPVSTKFGWVTQVSHFSEPEDSRCIFCSDIGPPIELVGDLVDPTSGWCICELRPIYRPQAEAFDHLLEVVEVSETVEMGA